MHVSHFPLGFCLCGVSNSILMELPANVRAKGVPLGFAQGHPKGRNAEDI